MGSERDDIQRLTMMLTSENIAVMAMFIECLFKKRINDIRVTKIDLCGKMFEMSYCCLYTVFSLFCNLL